MAPPGEKSECQRRSALQEPSGMHGGIGISAETALASAIAAARINRAFFNMGQKSPLFLGCELRLAVRVKADLAELKKAGKYFGKQNV
jgi:hypothetical protein